MIFHTNPLDIIDIPADAEHMSNDRIAYDFIVIHDTAGTDSANWLSTESVPNRVSAHRLIARGATPTYPKLYDGAIVKIVPDHMVAYTQGFGIMGGYPDNERTTNNLNRVSLSIEFERLPGQQYTVSQLVSGAKQVVEWFGLYDMPSILYHWQIDNRKDDPFGFPRTVFMRYVCKEMYKYINPQGV